MTKLNPKLVLAAMFTCMIAIALFFRGCDPEPNTGGRDSEVKEIAGRMENQITKMQQSVDSLNLVKDDLMGIKASVEESYKLAYKRLSATQVKLSTLEATYRSAIARKDTSEAVVVCNQAFEKVTQLNSEIASLTEACDSSAMVHESILKNRESVIQSQAELISDMRIGFKQVTDQYHEASKELKKLDRTNKKNQARTRIAVIATAIGTALITSAIHSR